MMNEDDVILDMVVVDEQNRDGVAMAVERLKDLLRGLRRVHKEHHPATIVIKKLVININTVHGGGASINQASRDT